MNNNIENYKELVTFFGRNLSNTSEIILFDTTKHELPVVTCVNRLNGTHNMTRELITRLLKNSTVIEQGKLIGKMTQNELGKIIKTSIYFIKDDSQRVIGAICINMSCDIYFQMQAMASNFLQFSADDITLDKEDTIQEQYGFAESAEPTLDMINRVVAEFGVEPGRISLDERTEILCDLFDLGVFEIKGAVARTAEVLKVSEQSVYRYLSKIRKARG